MSMIALLWTVLSSSASLQQSADSTVVRQEVAPILIWGDFDRDGFEDCYALAPSGDHLFRNAGDGSFEDVTEFAGLAGTSASGSASWGDYDRDGWIDLYVSSQLGGGHLFKNLGGRRFEDRTRDAGLTQIAASHDARWFDYDRDGYLDLVLEGAGGDALFHNRRNGTFEGVTLPGVGVVSSVLIANPASEVLGSGQPLTDPLRYRSSDALVRLPSLASRGDRGTTSGPAGPMDRIVPGNCSDTIADQAGGSCIPASSVPTLGMLYPMSPNLFVDSSGKVGVGTVTPGNQLSVSGIVESLAGGFRFPDGSVQASAASGGGGGVPSGYMILGESQNAPAGYAFTGLSLSSSGSFSVKTPMPTARGLLASAVVSGKIYAIGGYNGAYLAAVEEYDPAADTWSSKTSMPTARVGLAAAVANGKIYAIGGFNGPSPVATVEEYDPATDTWSSKTSMPTAKNGAAAAAVNGKVYAIGGDNGTSAVATVEEYDPGTNSWSTRAPLSTARRLLAAAVVNGKIYAIGGDNGAGYLTTVEEYDPAANSWSTKVPMSTARRSLAATALNGKVYAIGGNNAAYLATVEEYDPGMNSWSSKAPMSTATLGVTAVAVNTKFYTIGGSNGAFLATVEEFDPGILFLHQKN